MSNSRRERHSETDSQCDSLTPLLKAAAEGQHEAVSRLIANGKDDILEETDRRTGRTALHFACLSGSFPTVRVLLDAGAIVDGCDDTGRTALHLACLGGHDTVADALLHPMTYSMRPAMCQLSNGIAGASIDECDESGLTPLMVAASEGHENLVIRLLDAGADTYRQDRIGRTALHHASVAGFESTVDIILYNSSSALVNVEDEAGHTSLMLAASKGFYSIVELLLRYKATTENETAKTGQTALQLACLEGHLGIVGELLNAGAKANKCDDSSCTPLMLAASKGHDGIVGRLLRAGANVHQQDSDGKTAFHHACVSGHLEVVCTLMVQVPSLVSQVDEVEHTPLMLAARQGHQEIVQLLASYSICVDTIHQKSKNQQTALHLACLAGHLKVAHTLWNAGAGIDECDESGLTPLMLAASEGHDDIVASLLSASVNVYKQDRDGRTALHHACVSGYLEVVRMLMHKEPALVNQGDDVEHTPLMLAASRGQRKVVNFLTPMTVTKVHKKSKNRETALHLAYLGGHLEVVDTLLHAGAGIDECDESGLTPLMLAASEGHDWIVTRFLRAGANVCKQDKDGRTALHQACVSGHLKVLRTLVVEEPSLLYQGDEVEHTPLMLAASQGHLKIVQLLASMPVDIIHKKSKNRQTALHLACLVGHLEVADTLLHAGASIDECDESGLTPLMLAASGGHDEVVTHLLSAGANVRKQDSDWKTALHYAAEQGAKQSVNELLLSGASIDLKDVYGHTPLTVAAIKRQHDVALYLIKVGADVTQITRHEGRDLAEEVVLFAIQANLIQEINCSQYFCALFRQDSGVNLQNWHTYKHSVATLILSLCVCELRTVWFKHPTLLATDPPMTELMWSCHKGYDSLVKYLILQGVDINTKNIQGNAALHFAAQGNHIQCGLLLAKAGANMRTTNGQSETSFDVSTPEFRNGILEMLSFQTKKICCVLGNALNGKSTLIASLQNENANVFTKFRHWLFGVSNISQRTAGIEPVSLSSKRYGNVLFYDFAGQGEYHGPHELFLESIISRGLSSLAVVAVVNITEKQSVMFQQLNRWLHPFYKLPSTTNPIPVILVGSHLDKAKRQDEAKHNLYMCCEQLKSQGDSVLQFGRICCLDCRQPYAPDIQKLCKYLQDVPLPQCEDSHTGYSLPWVISQIRSSFTKEVLSLSEFAAWICLYKDNLPTSLPPAEDVCRDLASTGHFLYLPTKRANSDGWLLLDLPCILKDVYGNLFSSGKSKVNKFGLLSCAELPVLFPRFHPTMVRSILVSLGFGVEADPSFLSETTHLIEKGTDCKHEHLFIPALVTASQPNVFANASCSAHMFCWQFEVDEKLFLSPRILQAVILQLASHHVFTHKQGSEVRILACNVWLNGIFWKSRRDADVAVQISDNAAIHVIGCSEVSAEALCRYMSTVVQDIARTIKGIDASIYGSAYIVSPQSANPQFLLENPRPPAHQKFPIDVMLDSVRDGSETTIPLDSSEKKRAERDCMGKRKTISELFGGFKPSVEAVESFFILQDSTAQPTDHSSGFTASTEPHPNQVLPTTEHTDPPGASDHTGTLDGSTPTTPTGPTLTTPTSPLLSFPNMETLDLLVVYEVAARWQHVGVHLGMTSALPIIQTNHPSNVVQCCHDMFSKWLLSERGTGEKPRTWEIVLSALEKANYSNVAADLRRELDPAHPDHTHV